MSFQFKQFSIEDEHCAMKIGTEGCLLGAWADVGDVKNILDIGTGSGVIALMLAQRSKVSIDAVEIDNDAFRQASENFGNSPWNDLLQCFHTPIQEYVKSCRKKYELIVCCPPYFKDSFKAVDKKRNLARHTDSLSFEELLSLASRLLQHNGRFCTIIPQNIVKKFCDIALVEGFFPVRVTNILPKAEALPLRILLQLERSRKLVQENTIAILDKEGKEFTTEYKDLTKEFYLNF